MKVDSFKQIIGSVQGKGGQFEASIASSWLQGRATFGGLVAALAAEAMQQALGEESPLRSLQLLFSGPIAAGPVSINTQVLRQGKNVTSMRADLSQEQQIGCSAMACFGKSRQSMLAVEAGPRPSVAAADSLNPFPYMAGVTPEFLQHFEVRLAEGGYPFSNSQYLSHGIWARFKESGAASNPHLIALADIPPPIPLAMLTEPANSSSLTWSLEFLRDDWRANMEDWWYVKTQLAHCGDGYAQQQYTVWAPDGQPIALGRQVMTVFA